MMDITEHDQNLMAKHFNHALLVSVHIVCRHDNECDRCVLIRTYLYKHYNIFCHTKQLIIVHSKTRYAIQD